MLTSRAFPSIARFTRGARTTDYSYSSSSSAAAFLLFSSATTM